jgi:hypothetical protein
MLQQQMRNNLQASQDKLLQAARRGGYIQGEQRQQHQQRRRRRQQRWRLWQLRLCRSRSSNALQCFARTSLAESPFLVVVQQL